MVIDKQVKNSTNVTHSNLLKRTISKMIESLEKGEILLNSQLLRNKCELKIVEECETMTCNNVSIRC